MQKFPLKTFFITLILFLILILFPKNQALALASNLNQNSKKETILFSLQEHYQRNPEIAQIQSFLKDGGYYQGALDGIYGPQTAKAVSLFRQKHNLTNGNYIDNSFLAILAKIYEEEFLEPSQKIVKTSKAPFIVISLEERTLYLLDGSEIWGKFPVCIGKPSTPSPIGEWSVIEKGAWGEGFGSRWLGLDVPWGIFGIHGTNRPYSIGGSLSGGCIRMFNRDVIELYEQVQVGTYVFIINESFGVLARGYDSLNSGSRGSHVYLVQRRLKQLGYYEGSPDGVYGRNTINAVMKFQKEHKLSVNGQMTTETYKAMGLFHFE